MHAATRGTMRGWWIHAVTAMAAMLGLAAGLIGGLRIGGTMIGVFMALNSALMCGLLASTLADWAAKALTRLAGTGCAAGRQPNQG